MQWSERIGRRLKLRDLHILLAVVQQGSMAKAAAALAISQPAVSKAISDMEYTLGLRLLDRTRNGVEPTAYGRALVNRAVIVFDELKQGVEELEFLADPTAGELRIGSNESMAAAVLPAIIDELSQRYPRIVLHVAQSVLSTMQYRELREREVDLLFGRIPTPFMHDDLQADVLFHDQIAIVAGRQSRWARSRRLKLSDLRNELWVLPPADSLPGALAAELFRENGLSPPRAPVSTMSLHLTCKLLATGRFVATLPSSLLHFGSTDLPLKILPIDLSVQSRPVAIVTLKGRTMNPIAKLFIDCARFVTKPLAKSRVRLSRPSSQLTELER